LQNIVKFRGSELTFRVHHKDISHLSTSSFDIKGVVYSEDFEEGILPSGWVVVDGNGDGFSFDVALSDTAYDLLYSMPPNPQNFILYYSDDNAGSSSPSTYEEAISPPINVVGYDSLWLKFSWGLAQYCGDEFLYVDISIDGDSFLNIWVKNVWGSGDEVIDLTPYLPATTLKIKFGYDDGDACWGWAGAFDNIRIETESPPPPSPIFCDIVDQIGPFNILNYGLWDMAYDNNRNLIYQIASNNTNSAILIIDPATLDTCVVYLPIPEGQRAIAYDPMEDVVYVGGWFTGKLYKFSSPQCGEPVVLIDSCNLSGTPAGNMSGLAWDDIDGGIYFVNSGYNQMGKIDPTSCSVDWFGDIVWLYMDENDASAAGLVFSPEDNGLWGIVFDYFTGNSNLEFFIRPEDDPAGECVADTFCVIDSTGDVYRAWGVGQIDGVSCDVWFSDIWTNTNFQLEAPCPPAEIEEKENVIKITDLRVHPNPSSGSVILDFSLPSKSFVYISIYDVSGRLVKILFKGEKSKGSHSFVGDLDNIPTGVYFLRFVSENYSFVRRLVLHR
jgi:hypothetical protein